MDAATIYGLLIDAAWIVFLLYWLVASFRVSHAEKRESGFSRYSIMLLLVCGYVLIFNRRTRIGILGSRFLPPATIIVTGGIILTWMGVLLAIWARYHLAENWSARVTIKVGHELIRTGPYSRLRHPIYTGLFLATVGTAIAVGEWRGLLGVLIVVCAYSIKAKREEKMLLAQFGPVFEEHRRHTGFLLPRLR